MADRTAIDRGAGLALAILMTGGAPAGLAAQSPSPAPRGPAPTLTRQLSPVKPPDAAGFIQRWVLLEPIKVTGQLTERAVREAIDKDYFPNPSSVMPKDGDRVTMGGEPLRWHAVDTINYNVNLYHFASALNRPTSNVLFWVMTVVEAPREMPGVRLAIGSNAASVWWLNGEEAISLFGDRETVIDDAVSTRVTLRKGPNIISAAIVNGGGGTDFCARFLDGDDKPVTGLVVRSRRE